MRLHNAENALSRAKAIDPGATEFIVRLWDGFDGEWTDITGPVDAVTAVRIWDKRTKGGTYATSYDDIDYYAIYPASVKMTWSAEGRGSQYGG